MIDSAKLSAIGDLKQRAQALAMLDAILCPEWEYRYYSFDSSWGDTEQMASMRNGQGDEWFLYFGPIGAAIKGFAHESEAARNNDVPALVPVSLPASFKVFFEEPAFNMSAASFCYWCEAGSQRWNRVKGSTDDDGSDGLLGILIRPASRYQSYAEEYFDKEVPLSSIEALYEGSLLTKDLVLSINPSADLEALCEDAHTIGYPLAKPDGGIG